MVKLSEADPENGVYFLLKKNILVEISILINKDAAIFKIGKVL